MHRLSEKIPKEGRYIMVQVFRDDSERDGRVFMGSVLDRNSKAFLLGGLFESVAPLEGCGESGIFVPVRQASIKFPRPNVSSRLQRWKKISPGPTSTGQYLVYVNQIPVPMTVLNTKDLTRRDKNPCLLCVIGGTHSFYASDAKDLRLKLESENLHAFPEFTDTVYKDMLLLLEGSLQRRFLSTVSKGLHNVVE